MMTELRNWLNEVINGPLPKYCSGPSEDPAAILKRIGEEGSLNLDSGNWKSVSAQAKVQYIFYRVISCK